VDPSADLDTVAKRKIASPRWESNPRQLVISYDYVHTKITIKQT